MANGDKHYGEGVMTPGSYNERVASGSSAWIGYTYHRLTTISDLDLTIIA